MDTYIIVLSILIIVLLLIIVFLSTNKKGNHNKRIPNYKALFIIGISWLPIGIATDNVGLLGMGVVFFIIGVANKDKWGKETKWKELPIGIKRIKIIFMALLVTGLLFAIFYFLSNIK